tara:strand:+ start:84 stop:317 length:234 start_codon:yes stop_codon:yes gene_type:complete
MKLTKTTLTKIIKEEVGRAFSEIPSIDVSEEPSLSSKQIIYKIKEIVDVAVTDKGLGFRPGSAEQYLKEISNLLGDK